MLAWHVCWMQLKSGHIRIQACKMTSTCCRKWARCPKVRPTVARQAPRTPRRPAPSSSEANATYRTAKRYTNNPENQTTWVSHALLTLATLILCSHMKDKDPSFSFTRHVLFTQIHHYNWFLTLIDHMSSEFRVPHCYQWWLFFLRTLIWG